MQSGPSRLRRLPEELVRVRPKMRTLCTSGCTEDAIILRGVLKPGVSYLPKSSSRMPWLRKVREIRRVDRPQTATYGSAYSGHSVARSRRASQNLEQLIERAPPLRLRFAEPAHRLGERRETGLLARQPLANALPCRLLVVAGDQPVDPLLHVRQLRGEVGQLLALLLHRIFQCNHLIDHLSPSPQTGRRP